MNEIPRIDVYPVGLLHDIKHRRRVKHIFGALCYRIQHRNWRSVRNYFNGYLAELAYSDLRHTRCGRGWTKRAALSDLGRHLGSENS